MRLVLELSDPQAEIIQLALDLWSRIACGELTALLSHPEVRRRLTTDQGVTTEDVRRLLESLKTAVFGLGANAYYGIRADEVEESSRIAFDLMQVVHRHLVPTAHDIMQTSAQPLATIHDALAVIRDPDKGASSEPKDWVSI